MKRRVSLLLLIVLLMLSTVQIQPNVSAEEKDEAEEKNTESRYKLWYEQAATTWDNEALPIGNGYMGAMIFGGVEQEELQFNEKTLWTGGPGEFEDYRGNWEEQNTQPLEEIRALKEITKTLHTNF